MVVRVDPMVGPLQKERARKAHFGEDRVRKLATKIASLRMMLLLQLRPSRYLSSLAIYEEVVQRKLEWLERHQSDFRIERSEWGKAIMSRGTSIFGHRCESLNHQTIPVIPAQVICTAN